MLKTLKQIALKGCGSASCQACKYMDEDVFCLLAGRDPSSDNRILERKSWWGAFSRCNPSPVSALKTVNKISQLAQSQERHLSTFITIHKSCQLISISLAALLLPESERREILIYNRIHFLVLRFQLSAWKGSRSEVREESNPASLALCL